VKRRELLANAGWAAAASAVWALVPRGAAAAAADVAAPATGARAIGGVAARGGVTAAGDALLERLCDLVIPDTDTPGARAAGVPAFVALALQHGLADATPADRPTLQQRLDKEASGAFLALDAARQQTVLAALDAASFARDPAAAAAGEPAWARIKKLIVMGYYTSEAGATQELQYNLVPGRWDPDVPVKPGDRGSSSDWVGQTF
jgi:hypothetical protein